jgi:DNA-binding transcriptional LysR family regulator
MELRHLRYFVAVAEERHFGRAARRLQIAQPPLSRQIQALERELGFDLFDRRARRVELTPGGEALLTHVRGVFDSLEEGIQAARRAAKGETGRISVGYPSSLAYSGLTDLLRAFRARSPEVDVVVHEMPPQESLSALRERRIDVGFVRASVDDPLISAERVRREPLMVALPADHPLASRKRIALSLLANEPFVSFPRARGAAYFDQIMRLCHAAGFTPRIVQEAVQLDMASLIAAGFGVGIVPASMQEAARSGMTLRPIVGSPKTELFVAWRSNDASPVLRDFLAVVRDVDLQRRK